MLIPPHPEIHEAVKKKLTNKFLRKICKRLGLKGEEEIRFFDFIIFVSARYLELKRANSKRSYPSSQNKILLVYRDTLKDAKKAYNRVLSDNMAEPRFHAALRNEYDALSQTMKDMLKPYMNNTGYDKNVFSEFLDLLCTAATKSEQISLGDESTDLSKKFLAWWAGEIKLRWPVSSPIKFALGDHVKGAGNSSPSAEILYNIVYEIDPTVTNSSIITTMRNVLGKGENLRPADFFLESKKTLPDQ